MTRRRIALLILWFLHAKGSSGRRCRPDAVRVAAGHRLGDFGRGHANLGIPYELLDAASHTQLFRSCTQETQEMGVERHPFVLCLLCQRAMEGSGHPETKLAAVLLMMHRFRHGFPHIAQALDTGLDCHPDLPDGILSGIADRADTR